MSKGKFRRELKTEAKWDRRKKKSNLLKLILTILIGDYSMNKLYNQLSEIERGMIEAYPEEGELYKFKM